MVRPKVVWMTLAFIAGAFSLDTCWIYDYKHHFSDTPYKRYFKCPCGCCGTTWNRTCCAVEPVCHHNDTVPEEEAQQGMSEETRQALILSAIIVSTFIVLSALTMLMHLCGRTFMTKDNRHPPSQVVIYNLQEITADGTSGTTLEKMGLHPVKPVPPSPLK